MRINFLACAHGTRLSKTFTATGVEPYPNVAEFNSYGTFAPDLATLHAALEVHAEQGHCLLKGELQRPLVNERRAGATNALTPTQYIVLDLDFAEGFDSIDDFLAALQLEGVSYILHHSASSGIRCAPGLRSHIIMMLTQPVMPSLLKSWLAGLNLRIPELRSQCQLSASGFSLKWALDVTTCQNDKLIYIADPLVNGIDDPMAGRRLELHHRTTERAELGPQHWPAVDLRSLEATLISELREAGGLPRRTAKYQTTLYAGAQIEYLKNPTQAVVTGTKTERGFTYLNLNNGDSWGYYYPENRPEYLYNFKGEPLVRLRDIAPDYYEAVAAANNEGPQEIVPPEPGLSRIWRIVSRYEYNVFYFAEWTESDLRLTPQSAQALELMEGTVEFTVPGYETWTVKYDPTKPVVDTAERWINLYRPTIYKSSDYAPIPAVPPTIAKVLRWALSNDEQCFQHFLHWLAWIFQTGKMTQTAWMIRGCEGTGKGVLCNQILRPLFGSNLIEMTTDKAVESKNGWVRDKQILVIDEGEIAQSDAESLIGILKNMITEPTIPVREMRKQSREEENWINVILLTNSRTPIKLATSDRRWNVPPYQELPLLNAVDRETFIDSIKAELHDFAAYLQHKQIDLSAPPRPLDTEAKLETIQACTTSNEEFFRALSLGDFNYLVENYFHHPNFEIHPSWAKYREAITRWYEVYTDVNPSADGTRQVFITTSEAFEASKYILSSSVNEKFQSWLKHAGHKMRGTSRAYIDGERHRGYHIDFQPLEEQWTEMLKRECLKIKTPKERLQLAS